VDIPFLKLAHSPYIFVNDPPWEWVTRIPEYYNLWYCLKGEGTIEIDGKAYIIHPGKTFLLLPGTHIHARQNPHNAITNFAAHFTFMTADGRLPEIDSAPLLYVKVPARSGLEERMQEATARGRFDHSTDLREAAATVYLILLDILRLQAQKQTPWGNPRIENLLALIDAQPGAYQRLEELCQASGFSPAHLRRLFLELTGKSPMQYLLLIRSQ